VYRFLPLRDVAIASRTSRAFHGASGNPLVWQGEDLRRERMLMVTGGWRGAVKFTPVVTPYVGRSSGGMNELKLDACTQPYIRGRASRNDSKSGQQLVSSAIFKNVTNVKLYWCSHPVSGISRKQWQDALRETDKQRSNRHKRKFLPVLNQLSAFPHATTLHTELHQLLNLPDRDLIPDIGLMERIGQSSFWQRLRVLRIRLPPLTSGSRLPLQSFLDILAHTQLTELSIGGGDHAPTKALPADKQYEDAVTAASDAAGSATAVRLAEETANAPPLEGMALASRGAHVSFSIAKARQNASNETLATQLDFTPLAQLTTLQKFCISFAFSGSHTSDALSMAIARALPNFTHLHTLILVNMELDNVEVMCQPDALAGLQKLDLSSQLGTGHEADSLRRLACLANLRHVRTLIIRNQNLSQTMGRWPLLPIMTAREKDSSAFHSLRSYTYYRANHYCSDRMSRIPIPIVPFPIPLATLPPLEEVSLTLCTDGLLHSPDTMQQICTQLQHVRTLNLTIHVATGPPSKGFDWCRMTGWSSMKELTHLRIDLTT